MQRMSIVNVKNALCLQSKPNFLVHELAVPCFLEKREFCYVTKQLEWKG